jgi:5'-3' exonuclease
MKIFTIFAAIILGVVFVVFNFVNKKIPDSPEIALQEFYHDNRAEDQIMDPLILMGSEMIPRLSKEILNKNMIHRRYAIGAIGNIGDENAISILVSIVNDHQEIDYFRCDSLNSIAMINKEKAKQLALKYRQSDVRCLNELVQALLSDKEKSWKKMNYMRRGYLEA